MDNKFLTKLKQDKLPTIVLVGNGASALDHPLGEIIDEFDEVVRFNEWQSDTDKSSHIGSKITTWCLNETMPSELRPSPGITFVRILSEGYSNRLHADTKLMRLHPTIEFPSSGVVMAANFIRWKVRTYTVGMDGYLTAGEKGNPREHDGPAEQKFWKAHREMLVPLVEVV